MLEDMEEDAGLAERIIKKSDIKFESRRVDTREEFIESLNKFHPDVILSDHSLPQFNSMEAFKICKNKNLEIPFILVSGAVSEEFSITCLREGIDDYVLKSNLGYLPVAIKNAFHKKKLEHLRKRTELALRNQNKMLLKTNRELDNFTYQISHNLKAPLSSVMGLINLYNMEFNNKDDKIVEFLNLMKDKIERLNLTLEDILNHSRNSRIDLVPEYIDISSVINNCYSNLQRTDSSSKIIIKISIKQFVPFYSDTYRFEVICNNLLSNAIKYRDPQKVVANLEIHANILADWAIFKFNDNGIGIEKDQISKVFNMFTRGTESGQGAGLGLYIVDEMIRRMKGKIKLSSIIGKETSIQFILPNMLN